SYLDFRDPFLVTNITDPFGRSAHLRYDSKGRLESITDVLSLASHFTYDDAGGDADFITELTTPYGTTTFHYDAFERTVDGTRYDARNLTATAPLGLTERLSYVQGAPGIPFSDPSFPRGMTAPFNRYLNGRTTFYWDKHAFAVASGDY